MRYGVSGAGGDYFTSHLKVKSYTSSSSDQWNALGMQLLGQTLDIGMMLGVGALTGALGPSKKSIQKSVSADAIQHKQDLAMKTSQFSSKYPTAKFSADGKVKTTFEELIKYYDNDIKTKEDTLKDSTGKLQQCVTDYNNEKSKNSLLEGNIKTFQANSDAMDTILAGTISAGGESMSVSEACSVSDGKASVNNYAIDSKFPTNDPKTKDANETRRDQMKAAAQVQCNAYNTKAEANNNILKTHNASSKRDLDEKKKQSDDRLNALGDAKLSNGQSVKSVQDSIDSTKALKEALGTKADYDAAAKEINDLVDQVAEDDKLAKAQSDAEKSKQAYKSAKKNGASKADRKYLKQQRNANRDIYNNMLYAMLNKGSSA